MQGVFLAPFAVFHHFDAFCIVFLVLVRPIIAALALGACKSNSFTHSLHLTQIFRVFPIATYSRIIAYPEI